MLPSTLAPSFAMIIVVVVTLSFNAKMELANFECNLKTRDFQKWPRKGDLSVWERRGSGSAGKCSHLPAVCLRESAFPDGLIGSEMDLLCEPDA